MREIQILNYMQALPNAALRRIEREPNDKWNAGDYFRDARFNYDQSAWIPPCRCLVGIAIDVAAYDRYGSPIIRDEEANTCGKGHSYLPSQSEYHGSVEEAFDSLFNEDHKYTIGMVKAYATTILAERRS